MWQSMVAGSDSVNDDSLEDAIQETVAAVGWIAVACLAPVKPSAPMA
jgi:hypothetical protein